MPHPRFPKRRRPEQAYRPRFVIAAEGSTTELEYFRLMKRQSDRVCIDLLKHRFSSDPVSVLEEYP